VRFGFASKAKAQIPAARGADAEVPTSKYLIFNLCQCQFIIIFVDTNMVNCKCQNLQFKSNVYIFQIQKYKFSSTRASIKVDLFPVIKILNKDNLIL